MRAQSQTLFSASLTGALCSLPAAVKQLCYLDLRLHSSLQTMCRSIPPSLPAGGLASDIVLCIADGRLVLIDSSCELS